MEMEQAVTKSRSADKNCSVILGKFLTLSGLDFLIFSVRGLSGSSSSGVLRLSNLGSQL